MHAHSSLLTQRLLSSVHLPGNSTGQIPRWSKTPARLSAQAALKGGWLPSCPTPTSPHQSPPACPSGPSSPLLTQGPALLPGDRYLEDTHSQRCMFLQLAVLAGGLGGLPSQAVFVPPAAQVLMDRQTNWQQDKEAQGPLDDSIILH